MGDAFDVVVVGAGMAGLVAARALRQRGLKVCVVEARERVGGRVLSVKTADGGVAELGAEFVHGRAPELWTLIEEAGLRTVEREGPMLREDSPGGLAVDDGESEAMFEPLETLKTYAGEDMPFAEWAKTTAMEPWELAMATSYVEGFNAADARVIGVKGLGAQQAAEDASEGDRSWHVVGGYQQLAEYLAAEVKALGGEVRLRHEVTAVRWREGEVVVESSQGAVCVKLRAAKCVVTLPLSVLQRVNAGGVTMEPEPAAIAEAKRMAMGEAVRFTLVFREPWWQHTADENGLEEGTLAKMNFVFTPQRMPPVWWTSHAEENELPRLTGWVGGPRSETLREKSAGELGMIGCAALAEAFGVELGAVQAALLACYVHDWSGDAFSAGAYSYVPAGAMDVPAAMAWSERGTLYFAGEHTDVTGHWGTVHAAIRSGLRVAEQAMGESSAGR
ncbi:FAD-dependent oxidoreductase [Granulicella sp. 5B5]|uniref:flavin monoamine oxidase family protein n=1 Tax=Granulicella sp. 5B5 TaxID=1617967 RepID=UPI0015F494F1|nr:NAD(P)/FAD-dependent oxidoreductase [Granulicella sp. 5B5]QMV19017.1 FAD-dependent oxidoreductase [Granulicella sp. 5B5]